MSATEQDKHHAALGNHVGLRRGEPAEALDWLGHSIDCGVCAYRDRILSEGQCKPLTACIHDRYAKRIERFLDNNPEISDEVLDHPYFEVRAIATKYASIFRLPALLKDPDPEVRLGL